MGDSMVLAITIISSATEVRWCLRPHLYPSYFHMLFCYWKLKQLSYEVLLSLSVGMITFYYYKSLFVCSFFSIFLSIDNFFPSHINLFFHVMFLYLISVIQIYNDETLQGSKRD